MHSKTIKIKELFLPEEIQEIERIQKLAWKMKDIDVLPSHMLIAAKHAGGIVLGAYKNESLIGFLFTFLGERKEKLYHHCHMGAILPEYQGHGIGFRLFKELRKKVSERGYDLIAWTFDPLRGINANLFLRKLGGIARNYFRDFYGILRDKLDIGLTTDRLLLEWWIKSDWVKEKLRKKEKISPEILEKARIVNKVTIESGIEKPIQHELRLNNRVLLVEIPEDIIKIKLKDLETARKWRLVTREIFEWYLGHGYVITDFISKVNKRRRNFYVLQKELPKGIGEF